MSTFGPAFNKLLRAGDRHRQSRFHTEKGDRAPWTALLDLPRCLAQTVVFKLPGHRPVLPWIPYAAMRFLRRRLKLDWQVLEIGSGRSTLWFAQHCGRVVSIEADQHWIDLLCAEVTRRHLTNIELLFRWRADAMCNFNAWPDTSFDLVIIDGGPRPACFTAALPKLRPGGFIYVDNTDSERTAQNAAGLLLARAQAAGDFVQIFRGFVPRNMFVNEGMLLQRAPQRS